MFRCLIFISLLIYPFVIAAQSYKSCGAIKDDQARLACFDQVLSASEDKTSPVDPKSSQKQATQSKTSATSADSETFAESAAEPAASESTVTQAQNTQAQQQAAEKVVPVTSKPSNSPRAADNLKDESEGESIEEIAATIVNTRTQWPGKHVVYTLDNGQSWIQVRAKRIHIRPGDRVTIRKRRMSYLLLSQSGASVNVRRL